MPRKLKPQPSNVVEERQQILKPYLPSFGKGEDNSVLAPLVRGDQISVKDTQVRNFNIGLEDIDDSIIYYFNHVIKPQVSQNQSKIDVPIIYGSPENWKTIQNDGYLRDKDGKLMAPLIIFKRVSLEKNRNIGNKLDGNKAQLVQLSEVRYNQKNFYSSFKVLTNRIPTKQYQITVIPDYVTLQYECIIFTDYVEQNNKIIEACNYASDAYWGDVKRFNFRTSIDSFISSVQIENGDDRVAKTTFNITMNGYIIPDSVNKEMSVLKSKYSISQMVINFSESDTLMTSGGIVNKQVSPNNILIGNGGSYLPSNGAESVTPDLVYLATNNTFETNIVSSGSATFSNTTILQKPAGSPLPSTSLTNFTFYINGQFIPYEFIISYVQSGLNTILTVNTGSLGYSLDSGDTVIVIGKVA